MAAIDALTPRHSLPMSAGSPMAAPGRSPENSEDDASHTVNGTPLKSGRSCTAVISDFTSLSEHKSVARIHLPAEGRTIYRPPPPPSMAFLKIMVRPGRAA